MRRHLAELRAGERAQDRVGRARAEQLPGEAGIAGEGARSQYLMPFIPKWNGDCRASLASLRGIRSLEAPG